MNGDKKSKHVKGGLSSLAGIVLAISVMFLYATYEQFKATGTVPMGGFVVGIGLLAIGYVLLYVREVLKERYPDPNSLVVFNVPNEIESMIEGDDEDG